MPIKDPDKRRDYQRENMRRWREKHGAEAQAKATANMRAWRAKTGDYWNAYRRKRYAENAEHRARTVESVRKYRVDNPEKYREANRRWDQAHPEVLRAMWHRRRARELNAEGDFKPTDIKNLWILQSGLCVYCSKDLKLGFEIDHVHPLARGGTNWPENLQLLCKSCNQRKHTKTDEEFRAVLVLS
jgi:5-methylcytosine-specific restriction endonuclease McrA